MTEVLRRSIPIVVVALLASGCNPFASSSELDPMSLEPLRDDGVVTVQRDGTTLEVTDVFQIEPGDVVSTATSGARIHLLGRRTVLLGPRSEVEIGGDDRLSGLAGSIFLRIRDEMTVAFESVEVVSDSAEFRITGDRSSSAVVPFTGSVSVRRLGEDELRVGPFFEVTITPGRVGTKEPYDPAERDPWDEQYLAGVGALEATFDQFTGDLSRLIVGSSIGYDVIHAVMPEVDAALIRPRLGDAEAIADLIIAYSIAGSSSGDVVDNMRNALETHESGASWAIVARVSAADDAAVLEQIQAIGTLVIEGGSSGGSASGSTPAGSENPQGDDDSRCLNIVDCILQD